MLTLAASVLVVELQASLALIGDGIAASMEISRASDIADGTGATASSVAVSRSDSGCLADFEVTGRGGGDEAESGHHKGKGVHDGF